MSETPTERPWKQRDTQRTIRIFSAATQAEVCSIALNEFTDNSRKIDDAALIVKAVNAYDDMLAALKALYDALLKDSREKSIVGDGVEYHLDGQAMYAAINKVRAAIAKAGVK